MAIEFGPDHRPTSTVFASGSGTNQEERREHARMAHLLGIKAGTCLKCRTSYVSGQSDTLGLCIRCVAAAAEVRREGMPVSTLALTPDGSLIRPTAIPPAITPCVPLEQPLGADTLEDWGQ